MHLKDGTTMPYDAEDAQLIATRYKLILYAKGSTTDHNQQDREMLMKLSFDKNIEKPTHCFVPHHDLCHVPYNPEEQCMNKRHLQTPLCGLKGLKTVCIREAFRWMTHYIESYQPTQWAPVEMYGNGHRKRHAILWVFLENLKKYPMVTKDEDSFNHFVEVQFDLKELLT